MTLTRKSAVPVPSESRSGLVLLDRSLQTVAMDHRASRILADCSEGADSTGTELPTRVINLLNEHTWTVLAGTSVKLAGRTGTYLYTFFRLERPDSDAGPAILALHLQQSVSPEDAIQDVARSCNLTIRELEVLKGLSGGLTSKEIAAKLDISPNTVKSYIRLIMVKIGVTTRSGIVGKLLEHASGTNRGADEEPEAANRARRAGSDGK
jgi:DNA-binding CsgD family transcriptional regulator